MSSCNFPYFAENNDWLLLTPWRAIKFFIEDSFRSKLKGNFIDSHILIPRKLLFKKTPYPFFEFWVGTDLESYYVDFHYYRFDKDTELKKIFSFNPHNILGDGWVSRIQKTCAELELPEVSEPILSCLPFTLPYLSNYQ